MYFPKRTRKIKRAKKGAGAQYDTTIGKTMIEPGFFYGPRGRRAIHQRNNVLANNMLLVRPLTALESRLIQDITAQCLDDVHCHNLAEANFFNLFLNRVREKTRGLGNMILKVSGVHRLDGAGLDQITQLLPLFIGYDDIDSIPQDILIEVSQQQKGMDLVTKKYKLIESFFYYFKFASNDGTLDGTTYKDGAPGLAGEAYANYVRSTYRKIHTRLIRFFNSFDRNVQLKLITYLKIAALLRQSVIRWWDNNPLPTDATPEEREKRAAAKRGHMIHLRIITQTMNTLESNYNNPPLAPAPAPPPSRAVEVSGLRKDELQRILDTFIARNRDAREEGNEDVAELPDAPPDNANKKTFLDAVQHSKKLDPYDTDSIQSDSNDIEKLLAGTITKGMASSSLPDDSFDKNVLIGQIARLVNSKKDTKFTTRDPIVGSIVLYIGSLYPRDGGDGPRDKNYKEIEVELDQFVDDADLVQATAEAHGKADDDKWKKQMTERFSVQVAEKKARAKEIINRIIEIYKAYRTGQPSAVYENVLPFPKPKDWRYPPRALIDIITMNVSNKGAWEGGNKTRKIKYPKNTQKINHKHSKKYNTRKNKKRHRKKRKTRRA